MSPLPQAGEGTSGRYDKCYVIFLILFVLGILWTRLPTPPLNAFDQPFYLGIAHDILHEGKFTDGYAFDHTKGERPSGMRFAPVYPGIVATIAAYDPAFARGIDCVVDTGGNDNSCPNTARPVRALQFALLAGFYFMLWHTAGLITASRLTAWLALAVGLIAAPLLARDATYVMTEIVCLFCTTAATVAMLHAFTRATSGRPCYCAALAGLMLGLAILARPAFLYLALAALAFGLFHIKSHKHLVLQFTIAVLLSLTPWLARNAVVMHHFGLTVGYAAHTLIQRVAFDEMDWSQVPNSFLCWLPDGRSWLGGDICDVFGWEAEGSFYKFGNGGFMTGILYQAGGWSHVIPYLLTHNILAEPIKYAAVTLSLASRGAWIANDWGLVCLELCLWRSIVALRQRDRNFLLIALPAFFMLLFNAAVSVNQTRYNLMLIVPYSIAGALFLQLIAGRVKALGVKSFR